VIRLVTTDADRAALAGLRRRWTEEDRGGPVDDPGFEARFAEWLAGAAGRRVAWLAVLDDGAPVGMLNMAIFERMPRPAQPVSRWGYIANTYVTAEHRDRGIGAELVAAALAFAREQRFARIVLAPSERSRPFYARAGFSPAESLFLLELPD